MYTPPKDAVVPRSTRNVMGVCVIVFAVNYFVRFFGLSFSVLFGNEIATALSELPDQTFYEILAWMEFDFMSGSVSIISALIMLFVVLREAVKSILKKKNSFKGALQYCFMFLLISCSLFFILFVLLPTGPDGLSGTRAAGLGLGFIKGIVTLCATGVFILCIPWLFNPIEAQIGWIFALKQRSWKDA